MRIVSRACCLKEGCRLIWLAALFVVFGCDQARMDQKYDERGAAEERRASPVPRPSVPAVEEEDFTEEPPAKPARQEPVYEAEELVEPEPWVPTIPDDMPAEELTEDSVPDEEADADDAADMENTEDLEDVEESEEFYDEEMTAASYADPDTDAEEEE